MPLLQIERHRTERVGWLRAAVLGANDGILSTASLVLGVAAAHGTHSNIVVAGIAGLVAGAMSMAAGEYVSVHSQADTEQADLKLERAELRSDVTGECKELSAIYIARGLDPALAKQVAEQLMAHDALGAHARERTWDIRFIPCAPHSGGPGLGRQFPRWSGPASPHRRHLSRGAPDSPQFRGPQSCSWHSWEAWQRAPEEQASRWVPPVSPSGAPWLCSSPRVSGRYSDAQRGLENDLSSHWTSAPP